MSKASQNKLSSATHSETKPPITRLSATVRPGGSLEVLSHLEVSDLLDTSARGLYGLFRRCALAVLNCGSETDNAKDIFDSYRDFGIHLMQSNRGLQLRLENAPGSAFVDGRMIRGIQEHLFAVLRDIIYVHNEIQNNPAYDLDNPVHITSAVFHILRNARVLHTGMDPNLIVCWGGHSIGRSEYDYSKEVGYQLGLRGLNICTGCGPGAMKGPMKGAALGHAKQRIGNGRYLGITEPGIIASEPPNPIVNDLVIMPDIEKRLEAFVRTGHGVVIFPGGAGTMEELLYLLGILMHHDNREHAFPLILTGPAECADYFDEIDRFIGIALGDQARQYYQVIIDDSQAVAKAMAEDMERVRSYRYDGNDAFYFNWQLHIETDLQHPFIPTHEAMAQLQLNRQQQAHLAAANLRKAFSGIVAGNVKEDGIRAVEQHGPFKLHGEQQVVDAMDRLLIAFAEQNRMKLQGDYSPCYHLALE
ncbi:MAG: nucleotide 5'-monophosphate nucleosidase PpnN [Candidatus Thiodiazotropha lotti]|uniref:AMP nucleosidase n=1 Tax=Candidatus Thiodiazotropha lotti TaxID=2792787 RepID=A0A9E4N0R3_9GAMM|nr:nucleotide 5'-monophosphate nucleosidase PpnN [Candidatus Thiodiazotropha lotti]MCG7923307.1 nucleotide 5'-monophosphate nucleosidase PpnN [Candidatus Thiodiazotropha lotti]MCG7931172.1 nucleotide 5'-monophosphate nucleosidase PpnN [Candidatus Thiodiazotropha lotti]MCG7938809.1 nucleotide 5'-monophosphate nucleosidase PpnN [Candidatus Thiodiazotropha lotti]MCG7988520.1 nucleotide 5'-monophosphate nucleosidase PpnN [Candidatus Thiodiazotropha lotti]